MGSDVSCEINCSEGISVGNTSEWKNKGYWDYQYGNCVCINCGDKIFCHRYRDIIMKQISNWKPCDKKLYDDIKFEINSDIIIDNKS